MPGPLDGHCLGSTGPTLQIAMPAHGPTGFQFPTFLEDWSLCPAAKRYLRTSRSFCAKGAAEAGFCPV